MKNTLQKAAAGVLCCTMLFGMTACGQKPKTTQTTVPTLPQQTQSSLAAVQLQGSEELKKSILEHCTKYVAKYAMPRELEFRPELPKTLVGKVAYRKLEEEEAAKRAAAEEKSEA